MNVPCPSRYFYFLFYLAGPSTPTISTSPPPFARPSPPTRPRRRLRPWQSFPPARRPSSKGHGPGGAAACTGCVAASPPAAERRRWRRAACQRSYLAGLPRQAGLGRAAVGALYLAVLLSLSMSSPGVCDGRRNVGLNAPVSLYRSSPPRIAFLLQALCSCFTSLCHRLSAGKLTSKTLPRSLYDPPMKRLNRTPFHHPAGHPTAPPEGRALHMLAKMFCPFLPA